MTTVLLTPASQVGLVFFLSFFFSFCSQNRDTVSAIVMELLSSDS